MILNKLSKEAKEMSYEPRPAAEVHAWAAQDGMQFPCSGMAVNHNVKLDLKNALCAELSNADEPDKIMAMIIKREPLVLEYLKRWGTRKGENNVEST